MAPRELTHLTKERSPPPLPSLPTDQKRSLVPPIPVHSIQVCFAPRSLSSRFPSFRLVLHFVLLPRISRTHISVDGDS